MKKRPNILVFMADQLRFDALGCYGNNQIRTPNIDSLALTGSIFDNHFVQNPVCGPSRCTILTGRYPHSHGVRDNGVALRDEEVCLPEVLAQAGYRTAAIGKMHFTTQFMPKVNEEDDWPADHYGFQILHTTCDSKTGEYLDWLKEKSPRDYAIVKEQGERKAREDRASAADKESTGAPQLHPSDIDPNFHQSAWIADRMIDLIRESDGETPFFALCSFVDPHHPFDPPAPWSEMYDPDVLAAPLYEEGELEDKPPHFRMHRTGRGFGNEKYDFRRLTPHEWGQVKAAYYGMISLVDHNIGRVLAALKEQGLEEDTLVLFTSDHGEMLGDHGLLFKGPFHYDCLIKAPLIVKWPGVVPQGSRYAAVTEHVDLMPTLLDLAGVAAPGGVQGVSIAPILRGDVGAGRPYALTEFNCYDWGLSVKTLTGRDFKLTYYAGERFGELYDRNKDPLERVNLWDDPAYAGEKQRLLGVLLDRLIQTEDALPLRTGRY